jgi:hypothetical protein
LPEGPGLVTVFTGNRNDQIVPVEYDLGSEHSDAVDPLLDDLTSLVERLLRRWPTVQRSSGQSDPSATLQVDTQLRGGLPAAGEKD